MNERVLYVSDSGDTVVTLERATTDALLSELEARAALSPGQWTARQLERLGRLVHRFGWEVQPS